jgi:dipeptidyl aminopeptidase/acylaminoacyl peptidase
MTTTLHQRQIAGRDRVFRLKAARFRYSFIVLFLVLATAILPSRTTGEETEEQRHSQARRAVTVADAIDMTKLGDRYAAFNGQVVQFSPNGQYFVAVVRKGIVKNNTNEYSLLLWKTDRIFHSPAPEIALKMSSSSNRQAIQDVTWLADNQTVAFLGEHPGELHQLYSFNIRTRTLKKIIDHPTNLIWYGITPSGDKIAYTAETPVESIFDQKARQQGLVVSSQDIDSLLAGTSGGEVAYPQLFLASRSHQNKQLIVEGGIPVWGNSEISLSPDGRYIAMPLQPAIVPDTWKNYAEQWIQTYATWKVPKGQYSSLQTYALIDTQSGQSQPLLNVPINNLWTVVWSPDSKAAAIGGAYLPLDDTTGGEREQRRRKAFNIEVKVPGGDITIISGAELKLVRWDQTNDRVVLQDDGLDHKGEPKRQVVFHKREGKWEQVANALPEDVRPRVVMAENMNTPPKIYAIDPITQQKVLLLDVNPQFKDLEFGKVEEIKWKTADGNEVKGGLYYPIHYTAGKKYPLVIQTHDWFPDQFLIDGPFTTAFAAQPLAGKDIMVLQAEEVISERSTAMETTANVKMLEGAVDYLNERELIDLNRIGIIGFSRTCLHVKAALVSSRIHFSAASVTDGFDGGYFQYILSLPSGLGFARDIELINGGNAPFGEGLKVWKDHSPGFNTDKVRTPLRINALSKGHVSGDWEWFAALSHLGKPVEMVVIEDGSHLLEKPWDRIISQQGNVDWFSFWLKDDEDPDPAKAEQYARWRDLRTQQDQSRKSATTQ